MSRRRFALLLVVVAAAATYQVVRAPSGGAVDEAFRNGRSGVMVRTEGSVQRILPDDREGSRHQRFIVETPSGLTVLVAHNVDVAARVPDLTVGSHLAIRGQYEWNDRGGVIHWTHHDPDGEHEPGWIEWRGQRYE